MSLPLAALDLVTTELPPVVVGRPYAPEPLAVQGGGLCPDNGVTFRVVDGQLPEGITLTHAGYFRGIARREGVYRFSVRAVNSCQHATRWYNLLVDGAPILLASEDSFAFSYTTGARLPQPKTFLLSSNWRDMPYNCDAPGAAWLDWRPLRGRTPAFGSPFQGDPVDVYIQPDKLTSGVYRTTLRCTAWQSSKDAFVTVTLTVEATEVSSAVKYQ